MRVVRSLLPQISQNAGCVDGSIVVDTVKNGTNTFDYDAANDQYVDMPTAGIIDPTKVSRYALQNAASIARLMLTTEAVIAEKPKKETAAPARHGGMDDMMAGTLAAMEPRS